MNRRSVTSGGLSVPPMRMSRRVHCAIMSTVGARSPESGGILLGPVGSTDITDFYFDSTAVCTGATFEPNYILLRQKLKETWVPSGLDFKGMAHSHPSGFDRLSHGDLVYIRRQLERNPDMSFFSAPIVLPNLFHLRALVVLATQPDVQHLTTLQLF